jgi:hypothetical protein
MSTQPLVKPVQAKMLPNWVEYSGKSKMEDKNCRKTNLKCYNLPLHDCVKASDHPTVCKNTPLASEGIRMLEQLPIGFCGVPDPIGEVTEGCVRYDSITIALAECYLVYRLVPGKIQPDCLIPISEVKCFYNSVPGSIWTCVPGYN